MKIKALGLRSLDYLTPKKWVRWGGGGRSGYVSITLDGVEAVEAARASVTTPTQEAQLLDDLSPLYRRAAFENDLPTMILAAKDSEALALVMVGLDHFKRINDEHGHPAGDDVLRAVAEQVHACVVAKGRAYRCGEEEIAILLPSYTTDEATRPS